MIFKQLFEPESSTYTYLLADEKTKEAVLIDAVIETLDRDLQELQSEGLKLKYVLDTHVHADHITSAGELRKRLGVPTGVSQHAQVSCADIQLHEGQVLKFGNYELKVMETPGHTDSCLSFLVNDMVFTGDSLMIGATGRTDFQQGSPEKLFDSVHRLFKLPPETKVYPAHDYKGRLSTTIQNEISTNARIAGKTKEEYVKIMNELKLADPKKIKEAVPANLACGERRSTMTLNPKDNNGMPEVTPQDLQAAVGKVRVIDVRRPDEYTGELGHIPGAELHTLGPELHEFLQNADKNQEIVFVCLAGGRSAQATAMSRDMGFKNTINMTGGMRLWNELKLPTQK